MIVNSVDLSEPDFEADTSRHSATVTMKMTGASGAGFEIAFACHTTQPADCPSTLVLYELIKHAMAQARLLPAFRGPENAISLDLEAVKITAT